MNEYPLQLLTDPQWAITVLTSPLELLNDHFHLEKKAATNALDMMGRWQGMEVPIRWFKLMSSIAKDETDHMKLIARLVAKRGSTCSKLHVNPYAKALNKRIRLGSAKNELIDRLLISALIEIRSCERFELLSRHSHDAELAKLYHGLWGSERGHYLQFLEAASWVLPATAVEARWNELVTEEAQVMRSQSPGPRIHSWI